MMLAAIVGQGAHWLLSSRSHGVVTASANDGQGLSGPLTDDIKTPTASYDSTQKAELSEKEAFSKYPLPENAPPLFTDIDPAKLHRAKASYVPFPKYTPSSQKLHLQNTQSVYEPARTQLVENYQRWKWRQGEEASQIDRLMDLYSPNAQIFYAPGKETTVAQLRQMIVQMRLAGFFTSVTDQKPPTWTQNAQADEAEVLAYHLYMDDSHNRLWGQRRLVWHKQGDKWLIVRDDFPPCYFSR